ncbi:MAG: hypothetical protein AAFY53_01240 [Pseudomonadota bacterium]
MAIVGLVWWLGKSLEAFQVLPIYKTLAMELTRTVGGYAKTQQTMVVRHLVDVTRDWMQPLPRPLNCAWGGPTRDVTLAPVDIEQRPASLS